MTMAISDHVRRELVARRVRLEQAVGRAPAAREYQALLAEVDAALARLDAGTYGLCDACGEPIEPERLLADPLLRRCLDHLSAEARRGLEQDLELAARIQAALLPPRELELPGWDVAYHFEPFGHVGGDYCDLIPSERDGTFVFLLGDVSGKGVAASILMSNLHATFRSLAAGPSPIEDMMARANRLFCQSTLTDHYATLVCGRLAPSGDGWLANAGHWPPLLVRRGRVERLDSDGLALGMFCHTAYRPRPVHLGPGDLLVLYSDGLTEACDRDGREYGTDRLAAHLAGLAAQLDLKARDVVHRLVEDVAAFCAGAAPSDDVTLMVVRRPA